MESFNFLKGYEAKNEFKTKKKLFVFAHVFERFKNKQ